MKTFLAIIGWLIVMGIAIGWLIVEQPDNEAVPWIVGFVGGAILTVAFSSKKKH